jgi:hypothetical protein
MSSPTDTLGRVDDRDDSGDRPGLSAAAVGAADRMPLPPHLFRLRHRGRGAARGGDRRVVDGQAAGSLYALGRTWHRPRA